jgi:hypothetical protein
MNRRPRLTLLASLALASLPLHAAAPAVEAEPTLTLSAFHGVPAASGRGYRIDERVPVSGFHGQFVMHTDVGDIPADGVGMLRQRVAEVGPAIELQQMSQSDVFVDAMGKSVSATAGAIGKAVTSPVETAKGVPAGVGRFFKSVGQGVQSVTSGGGDGDTSDAAKDALGINKAKRQLAQKVGVDPYTTNPILAKRLDTLANAAFAGGVSIDVALSVATAGVGTAISVTKTVSNLAWELPPEDVRARNDSTLAALGIAQDARDRLLDNRWYTPTMALALVEELKGLGVREGAGAFVALAAGSSSETEARFYIGQLALARDYAKGGESFTAIEPTGKLAAFRTAKGGRFMPAPLDYLAWTEGVKAYAEREGTGSGARVVWLTGVASPSAAKGLKEHGFALRERVELK